MNKRKLLLGGMFIFIFFMSLFLTLPLEAEDRSDYKGFLNPTSLRNIVRDYFQIERRVRKSFSFKPEDFIVMVGLDLPLSLFCLWVALFFLTEIKSLVAKKYIWFLFVFNLSWFISLILLKGAWYILDFLIIRARPELLNRVVDNFSVGVMLIPIPIYIWLLARTFNLNFFGASITFFTSHLIYFLIGLLVLFIPLENKVLDLVQKNVGFKPIVRSYLWDARKITSRQSILTLVKVRPFHL